MRKLIRIIAFTMLLCIAACGEERAVCHLSGTAPAGGDTLYLYGLDRRYEKVDTIIADENGRFEYTIATDTLFPANLLLPTGEKILLYVEPDATASVERDSLGHYNVKSSVKLQQTYDSMATRLNSLSPKKHFDEIEKFVDKNPLSEANIMLWRNYLVEIYKPSRRDISLILNKFGGKLMDNDYVIDYKEHVDKNNIKSGILYTSLPTFNFTSLDGTKITNATYKEKFLVLNFWASWDSHSLEHLKNITAIDTLYNREEVTFLNISLDCDTAAWSAAVRKDSIPGDHVCDRNMWDNPLVKRYNIGRIPYSVIVNPQLLNIHYNIHPSQIEHTMDSLIKDNKEKIKKKEEEKRKKRK